MRKANLFHILILLSASLFSSFAASPGLIAHWTFDGDFASGVQDETGVFNGVPVNATRVAGRIGSGALQLNGSNSYVLIGGLGTPLQLLGTPYTISWWQKWAGPTASHQNIYSFEDGADYSGGFSAYYLQGGGQMVIVHDDGNTQGWYGPTTTDTNWHQYAITFDGINLLRLYVDGVLSQSKTVAGPLVADDDPFVIGALRLQNGTFVNFFNGLLDDFRIYNLCLNAIQVAGLGPNPPQAPPQFLQLPVAQQSYIGGTATFSVSADGPGTLSYQWLHAGTNLIASARISSVTGTSLQIQNITLEDAGLYRVVVTNEFGKAESSDVPLTLLSEAEVRQGLVAHWTFDEDFGSTIREETGRYNGTSVNALRVPGKVGAGAMQLNGANAYMLVDGLGTPIQLLNTPYTIAWWQKWNGPTSSHQNIYSMEDGADYSGGYSAYFLQGGGSMVIVHDDGATTGWYGPTTTDTNWNHYAITYSGTELRLYVNGIFAQSRTVQGPIVPDDDPLVIGALRLQSGTFVNFFNGALDDFRIYRTALSPEDVAAIGPKDPAEIVQAPVGGIAYVAGTAQLSVVAKGTIPLTYQWLHEGTNLISSAHILGATGSSLQITNVTMDDAGLYRVIVSNQFGVAESTNVTLTVLTDTEAPLVTLTSPSAGLLYSSSTTIIGTSTDNVSVVSIRWETNGVAAGSRTQTAGAFSIPITLSNGENRLKVIARDQSGNEGSAEVIVTNTPILQSSSDLWDVSQGTQMTATSGTFTESSPGMLGGVGYPGEPGITLFSDGHTNGFVHTMDWKTKTPVNVSQVRLFAKASTGISSRSFTRFTVKAKSAGSSNFDTVLFNYTPTQPIPFLNSDSSLILLTNFSVVTAQEFRAEVVQLSGGPRVIELDAFGPDVNSAPEITSQPQDANRYFGGAALFSVTATGSQPITYQWQREGTNLTESAHFVGVNSWALKVNNLTADDTGAYSVFITNQLGKVTSSNAVLSVSTDTEAPIITILSPQAGTNTEQSFALSGTITDNDVVASAKWEREGVAIGALTLASGHFTVPGLKFALGENHFRIIATDRVGFSATNDLTVTWSPARAIFLSAPATQQEGGVLTVPVSLVTTGGLSGATFAVSFDTNYLTAPTFDWVDEGALGLTSVNLESNKVFRASFALGGTSLAAGSRTLANMTFRTRSVGANTPISFTPALIGFYSDAGDIFTNGNYIQAATNLITKRKIIGDNNANDHLDVGDASLILRLVTGIDRPRSWDVAANDLNSSLTIDSGDVIKVLRAVVGIDPQPTIPAAPARALRAFDIGAAGTPIQIVADKTTAVAGEKVTVDVRLADQTKSLTGVSFRMEYPTNALKLENASSQILGPIIPSGSLTAWNVSPSQYNYATQDGAVSLAASSAATWTSSNGIVARLTFTVQAGATARFGWPLTVKNVEVSRPDFQIETIPANQWTFVARAAEPAQFTSDISFNGNTPRLTLQGDLGATYLIEASSDLSAWEPIGVYYNANGALTIEDPAGAGSAARYYRATLQQ